MVRGISQVVLAVALLQAVPGLGFWPFTSKKDVFVAPAPERVQEVDGIPPGVLPARERTVKKPRKEDRISVEHLKKLAEGGNANAMLALGKIYYEGAAREKKDLRKAFGYFEDAARLGLATAVYNAALCYQKGHGVKKDPDKARELFYQAADAKVVPALYVAVFLAEERHEGARALRYVESLCDTGDVEAMCKAATYLQQGLGGKPDQERAADRLEQAARKGYAPAQIRLADCYQTGNGRPRNYLEMFNWLSLAAQDGNPEAQAKLGYCHLKGMGIARNPDVAVQWFRTASEAGYPVAMIYLGDCYQTGNGVGRDPGKAFQCYLKAARLKDSIGQFSTGVAYASGLGVKQDEKEAVRWLEESAGQGFSPAMVELGRIALYGADQKRAKPDAAAARRWFEQACRERNPDGMVELALLYLYTSDDPEGRTEARRLLGQAAGLGSRRALDLYEKHFGK